MPGRPHPGPSPGALNLAYGVLLGIIARERFGVGQHIHTSQLGGQIMLQATALGLYFMGDRTPPKGLRRTEATNPLTKIYKCGDGRWVALGASRSDRHWAGFVRVVGIEDLEHDPRFKDRRARYVHCRELITILDASFLAKGRDEWVRALKARGVLCAPVQTYEDLAVDPQVTANGYLIDLDDPKLGKLKEVGVVVGLSETPGFARKAAPGLGQHTEAVLQEFGYSQEQVKQFREKGVI